MAPKRRVSSVESETKRRCQSISKAIKTADGISDACKTMLSGMSSFALETYQSDRHAWQSAIVDMCSETVRGIEEKMVSANKAREAEVGKANNIKAARAAAVTAAEAALAGKIEEVSRTQGIADECSAAVKAAKAVVSDALKKQTAGDAQLVEVGENKTALETCKAESFTPLKEGTCPDQQALKKAANNVASIGKRFDLEKAMVHAALEALKQPPAERSAFLVTSVDQMTEKLDAVIAGFNDELAKGEPGKQERAAAVAGAEAAKEGAVAKEKEAKADAAAALVAKRDADAELKGAKKAVARFYADMKKLMDEYDQGPLNLKEFQETVKADLAVLQTLAAPPAEEEPAAEEAADESAAAEA